MSAVVDLLVSMWVLNWCLLLTGRVPEWSHCKYLHRMATLAHLHSRTVCLHSHHTSYRLQPAVSALSAPQYVLHITSHTSASSPLLHSPSTPLLGRPEW